MTKLTQSEMAALAPYEYSFKCAMESYLRSIPRAGQDLLHQVYKRVTGEEYRRTDTCGQCELELMTFVARWYFDTQKVAAKSPKSPKSPKSQSKE